MEFAPGIPSKKIKEVPRISEPQEWRLAVQRHFAHRAGPHYDLRIVDDKTGKAYSWACKNLPLNPGDKTLAKLQPTHTASYSNWSGVIESGYGAGTVKLFSEDKIEVLKADLDHITFNVYKSNGDTNRYAMINTGDDNWLFHNVTPTRTTRPLIPATKPSYKSEDISTLDPNNPNEVWAPKIDGALNAFLLRKGKNVESYSYRPSVKSDEKLIDHTYRLPHYKTPSPMNLPGNTVVLGEVFATDQDGNALPSSETAARLLSNVWRSRELQKSGPLQTRIFNVLTYKGKDVSDKPYSEKLYMLKHIADSTPGLHLPPLATTPEQKTKLLNDVRTGNHPLSREGIVIYNMDEAVPAKAKVKEDYDVHVKKIVEGEGALSGKAAGGFEFSYTPEGPTAGRVGTGFDLATRIDMRNNPAKYVGQIARVWAQQKLPSGALRMPVFKDLRPELWKKAAMNKIAYIEKTKAGYHVRSEKGKNLGGPYASEEEAKKRLRQVEYFKHHKTAEVQLTDYQKELKTKMQNQHGMIVGWGLGSGKTIGSIAAADQFGDAKAIVPASLRGNFKKGLKSFKPKHHFDIDSYEGFTKNPGDVSNKTLIFDEAHRLRTSASKRSQAAQSNAFHAKKVLLLTGTPIQNRPHEIAPLVNIAAGKPTLPVAEKDFNAKYVQHVKTNPGFIMRAFGARPKDEYHAKNLDDFKARVKPYYMHLKDAPDPTRPKVTEHTVNVEMSPVQTKVYKAIESRLPGSVRHTIANKLPVDKKDVSKLNAFLSATRQISNTSDKFFRPGSASEYSPKLHAVAKSVSENKGKSLIYSNYIESGVTPLSELLNKRNIPHGVFTGKQGDKEKKKLVDSYNSGKYRALIVSSSGGEGLDLKGTRQVHITEPHWNSAKIDQVVGRSARKGSHAALPESERNVDVFNYHSMLPEKRTGFLWLKKTRPVGADQYLESMSKRKSQLNNEFLDAIK